jgi:hypothetical protein
MITVIQLTTNRTSVFNRISALIILKIGFAELIGL